MRRSPELSPASDAVVIFDADEDGRPIKHAAEVTTGVDSG
jgi:hypothetical protein